MVYRVDHSSPEERIEYLENQVEILKRAVGGDSAFPFEWNLTLMESRLLGVLTSRQLVSRQQAMDAMYYDRMVDEEPEEKIVDVYLCKLRKKVTKHGIVIHGKWGQGWYLDQPTRDLFVRRKAA